MLNTLIDESLVRELEARFPPKRPTPNQSIPEIFEYSGKVALVEYLRNCFENQQLGLFS